MDELRAAFKKLPLQREVPKKIGVLKQNIQSGGKPATIMIPGRNGYQVIGLSDILYLEAEGPYVYVYQADQPKILATFSLGHFEELLENSHFFRIHKSYIVNTNKVNRVITRPQLSVEIADGTKLDLAVRRKESFIEYLNRSEV
jgi:two-component system LytT family response regulator